MKTSKVKSVQANGTFESNYGTMYKFEYLMEDGQVVNCNHKTPNPYFNAGDAVEYQITNAQYNNGKIQKPQEQPYQGGNSQAPQRTSSTNDSILMQVCLKVASEMYAQRTPIPEPAELSEYAKDLFKLTKDNLNNL